MEQAEEVEQAVHPARSRYSGRVIRRKKIFRLYLTLTYFPFRDKCVNDFYEKLNDCTLLFNGSQLAKLKKSIPLMLGNL